MENKTKARGRKTCMVTVNSQWLLTLMCTRLTSNPKTRANSLLAVFHILVHYQYALCFSGCSLILTLPQSSPNGRHVLFSGCSSVSGGHPCHISSRDSRALTESSPLLYVTSSSSSPATKSGKCSFQGSGIEADL